MKLTEIFSKLRGLYIHRMSFNEHFIELYIDDIHIQIYNPPIIKKNEEVILRWESDKINRYPSNINLLLALIEQPILDITSLSDGNFFILFADNVCLEILKTESLESYRISNDKRDIDLVV